MPDFRQTPTGSMGVARSVRSISRASSATCAIAASWPPMVGVFAGILGDGEMDEPESIGRPLPGRSPESRTT